MTDSRNDLPPPLVIRDLVTSVVAARCLQVVAEAGVADALGDKAESTAQLAKATGLNADALERMLRLLVAYGVFARTADGWAHTEPSRLLRSDDPRSMRPFARMIGLPAVWNDFTELGKVARSGKPALDWAGLVAHFSEHPDESRVFNEAMVAKSAAIIPAVIAAYDFTPFKTIADIGGGRGHLLHAILAATPSARGILFDLPHVIADAGGIASERLRLVAGDFFQGELPAADAYLLMEVIHDWADDDAVKILAAVRKAARPGARVLLVEAIIADEGPHFAKVLDVIMLAVTGGRERTAAEYQKLLEAAGLRFQRIVPTQSQCAIIESIAD